MTPETRSPGLQDSLKSNSETLSGSEFRLQGNTSQADALTKWQQESNNAATVYGDFAQLAPPRRPQPQTDAVQRGRVLDAAAQNARENELIRRAINGLRNQANENAWQEVPRREYQPPAATEQQKTRERNLADWQRKFASGKNLGDSGLWEEAEKQLKDAGISKPGLKWPGRAVVDTSTGKIDWTAVQRKRELFGAVLNTPSLISKLRSAPDINKFFTEEEPYAPFKRIELASKPNTREAREAERQQIYGPNGALAVFQRGMTRFGDSMQSYAFGNKLVEVLRLSESGEEGKALDLINQLTARADNLFTKFIPWARSVIDANGNIDQPRLRSKILAMKDVLNSDQINAASEKFINARLLQFMEMSKNGHQLPVEEAAYRDVMLQRIRFAGQYTDDNRAIVGIQKSRLQKAIIADMRTKTLRLQQQRQFLPGMRPNEEYVRQLVDSTIPPTP